MPRPIKDGSVRLNITLTRLQADRLKTISDAQYRTKTSVISQALDEFFLKMGNVMK